MSHHVKFPFWMEVILDSVIWTCEAVIWIRDSVAEVEGQVFWKKKEPAIPKAKVVKRQA